MQVTGHAASTDPQYCEDCSKGATRQLWGFLLCSSTRTAFICWSMTYNASTLTAGRPQDIYSGLRRCDAGLLQAIHPQAAIVSWSESICAFYVAYLGGGDGLIPKGSYAQNFLNCFRVCWSRVQSSPCVALCSMPTVTGHGDDPFE